ncbi:MAG: hypothetical protein WCX22_00465 [Methanoregula sp.]
MNKFLWLIVATLAFLVIVGCTGLWTPGPGGLHTGSGFPAHGTTPDDTLTILPDSTANQTLKVPEIPPAHDGTVAFVPPLSVAGIRMEYSPGWALTLCGIAGFVILVVGYVIVRRYP